MFGPALMRPEIVEGLDLPVVVGLVLRRKEHFTTDIHYRTVFE
jgi:hypothetical protein